MTFLNAALLAGLAAASLPILIHLFSRRRYPLVDFSSLRFLKILQRQQMHKLRVRQWILLLLRTLAVILIVLSFARPALNLQSGKGFLTAGRVGAAIVMDGSGSMLAKDAENSTFQKAKRAALDLVATLSQGDRVMVILARNQPSVLINGTVKTDSSLLKPLSQASAWEGTADLNSAADRALEWLLTGQDFRSELYLLSDFTTPVSLPPLPDAVHAFFIPLLRQPLDNLAVQDVSISSEILEPDQPVELEISLANLGKRDQEDVYYSIFLQGRRVGEGVVTLAADAKVRRTHIIQPEKPGLLQGLVQIEAMDALSADNRSYFCFSIPNRVKVLLIGRPAFDRSLRLALRSSAQKGGIITFDETTPDQWDSRRLGEYGVLVFNDPPGFNASQTQRLLHFVQNGGGVLLLPGDMMDPAALNRGLLKKLKTMQWGEKIGRSGDKSSFRSWKPLDLNAPLFKGMFRPGSQPTLPHFYQSIRLLGTDGHTLIAFADGEPFLSERRAGKGRVILGASSPDESWSNWSQKGIFVPLIHRLMLYLAGHSQGYCSQLSVGDDLRLEPRTVAETSAELTFPDGKTVKLPLTVTGQQISYFQPSLPHTGIYELRVGKSRYLSAVNFPPAESTLTPLTLKDSYPAWFAAGARIYPPEQLSTQIVDARFGKELWKFGLIAGIILLLVESFLGRTRGKTAASQAPTDITGSP